MCSTLTRALTRSSCFCSKVARSTCPSSVGSRLMSSGWIFSSRALTSHSCLCLALRNGFASKASKFGSPAPVEVKKTHTKRRKCRKITMGPHWIWQSKIRLVYPSNFSETWLGSGELLLNSFLNCFWVVFFPSKQVHLLIPSFFSS